MPFSGCDKCGIAHNDGQLVSTPRGPAGLPLCPECGRPMRRVSIAEALELVRERAEADEWRATAAGGGGGSGSSVTVGATGRRR